MRLRSSSEPRRRQMANFVVVMPQRQVASSIPAAREYMRERWGMAAAVESDTAAELEFDADEGDEVPSYRRRGLAASWLTSWRAAEESTRSSMRSLLLFARRSRSGTAVDGKILVFSFFRKTIEHLARRLDGVIVGGQPLRVSVLYGPTPEEERHRIVAGVSK